MLGTPTSMAPEQMRGHPVDARTDVYALGLLAFHMLTGAPAFGGTPGVVQSYMQVHGPRPRASTKADIDPAIDEPIQRALAPEPDDRYTNARELAEALRAVVRPVEGGEADVLAVYVEGGPVELAKAASLTKAARMTIALSTPDSVIAVIAVAQAIGDLVTLKQQLGELAATGARVALGRTRATICGSVIDGPALDVESWAPYPILGGLWVAEALR
jgi:hypothetical protein